MSTTLHQQVRALLTEVLAAAPRGHYQSAVEEVSKRGVQAGVWSTPPGRTAAFSNNPLVGPLRHQVEEEVRQLLWQFIVQGLVVPGKDAANAEWPWYRLTERGNAALGAAAPQPYDPDGFIGFFDRRNPDADHVLRDYVVEAVNAFNVGCLKASAVMLGCASEKSILLLLDAFAQAITDGTKRSKFEKDTAGWTIASKYRALKDRLDKMVAAKRLPRELADSVRGTLDIGFNLVREQRNAAGHPEIVGQHDPDSVFISLRFMSDYVARVGALIGYFGDNPADW